MSRLNIFDSLILLWSINLLFLTIPVLTLKSRCPPVSGDMVMNQYQIYPENMHFNPRTCLLYAGGFFNSSVVVFDPYTQQVIDIIEFPGITHNVENHVAGIGSNPVTGHIAVIADAWHAFETGGKDLSGTNYLVMYDPVHNKEALRVDITKVTNNTLTGIQDVAHDAYGNIYVMGTLSSSIIRVGSSGKRVSIWYAEQPIDTSRWGFMGIAVTGRVLLTVDYSGRLWRFDTTASKGIAREVKVHPAGQIGIVDAFCLPSKYGGTVALLPEDESGVQVLRSADNWLTAEYVGLIPKGRVGVPSDGAVSAVVQMGQSIYHNVQFFHDPPVAAHGAGNRSSFSLYDITDAVDILLST